ncbi:MAG: acyl-CoA dehydrogenase, partial [Deltaproteobacteria bacterium]
MDFSIPDPVRELQGRFREFVKASVMPLEPRLGEKWSALEPALRSVRAHAKATGLWAPFLPRSLGGLELPLEQFALVSEELGRSPLGHYCVNGQAPDVGNMELLLQ